MSPVFTPVRTRRSFEEALDQIVERIKTGDLRVGDRMPSEREMAAAMGISRPTLREALKLLSEAEIIEVRARSGGMTVLRDLIPPELLTERSELVLEEVGEVLEARRMIEIQVAQVAGQKATESDFEALQTTIELQAKHEGEHDRLLQLDERFHLEVAQSTRNVMLLDVVRMVLRRLAIARDMTPREPSDWKLEVAIHSRTLAALRSRDPRAIDAAMDEHMSYLEAIWEQETGRRVERHALSRAARKSPALA